MNNLLASTAVSKKSDKPDFVEPLRSVFFQYFEQLLDGCCTRIDLEFGLQLGKDREKINKDLYLKLLEYLRSVRNDIKGNYLLKLNENFEHIRLKKESRATEIIKLTTASFASDDSVQEDHITKQIIRQCQQKYLEDLIKLNQQLAALLSKSAIHPSQNPVAPENLLKALIQVIKPLKLSSLHRIALYKTFQENVFSQMGFIYHELIKQCESSLDKIKAEKEKLNINPRSVTTDIEPLSYEFQQLQANLMQWRQHFKPSAYDLLHNDRAQYYEHFEIKNALQIVAQFSMAGTLLPEIEKQPLKWGVTRRLEELNFSDDSKTLARADEDVLDLVSLIFARIAESPYLSDSFKRIITPLMIPMSAACLKQYDALTNRNHPIRQVLDSLLTAGLFLNPDSEISLNLHNWISGVVSKLLTFESHETSDWALAAHEISLFLEKQQENSRLIEAGSIQVMIDQEDYASNLQAVIDLIDQSIINKDLPNTVVDFLKNVWKGAMLCNYLVKDQQPERWEKAVRTMNELIASVSPQRDCDERRRVLKSIPEMIKELRHGLNLISYDKELQTRFFKELAVLHVILLNNKEVKKTEALASKESIAPSGKINTTPEKTYDRFNVQVSHLKMGDWFVFHFDGKTKWAKLARKSSNDEILWFVDKNGERSIQIDAVDLADQFRKGQTTQAESTNQAITDIILSELNALNTLPYH